MQFDILDLLFTLPLDYLLSTHFSVHPTTKPPDYQTSWGDQLRAELLTQFQRRLLGISLSWEGQQ